MKLKNLHWNLVQIIGWILAVFIFIIAIYLFAKFTDDVGFLNKFGKNFIVNTSSAASIVGDANIKSADNSLHAVSASETLKKEGGLEVAKKTNDDGNKDAISNVMTAVSVVVAVITLIMTLGIPWFYERLKEINNIKQEVEERAMQLDKRYSESIALAAQQVELHQTLLNLQQKLLDAMLAVLPWAVAESLDTARAIGRAQHIGLLMETLMAHDETVRHKAFGLLERMPWDPQFMPVEQTTPVREYQKACHLYHAKRIGIPDANALTQGGLWCQFWDAAEIARYYNAP